MHKVVIHRSSILKNSQAILKIAIYIIPRKRFYEQLVTILTFHIKI